MTLEQAIIAADTCMELPDIVAAYVGLYEGNERLASYCSWVLVVKLSPQEPWIYYKPLYMHSGCTEDALLDWMNNMNPHTDLSQLRKDPDYDKLDFKTYSTTYAFLAANNAILRGASNDVR